MVDYDNLGRLWIRPQPRKANVKKPEPKTALGSGFSSGPITGDQRVERIVFHSSNPCDWTIEERLQFLKDTLPAFG